MEKLNSLERINAVLQLQEPDQVPTFEWSINKKIRHSLFPESSDFDFVEKANLDGVVVYADYKKDWLSKTIFKNEWDITYAYTEEDYPTCIDSPIKEPDQIDNIIIPDPCAPWRFDSLKEAVKRFKGEKAILFRLRDASSLPRDLRSMSNIMMDYILNPDLVNKLVEISTSYYTKMAFTAMELGADIFWTSDDYCDNRGPIMGPEPWKEFILPGLTKLIKSIKKEGYQFIKHNDGNINSILEEMVKAGIDCIDPIDAEAGMDLKEIKDKYGSQIAIKGGVPVTSILTNGTEKDVVKNVKQCITNGGMGGGYILSSSSDIIASVNPENYHTMLKTVREFGTYPLDIDRLKEVK
ncbi:MAG: hypothetical protein L3J12_03305 [Spirochaetales bacterium]|nr:hypothetical protein [Spirochaetales bacterium]